MSNKIFKSILSVAVVVLMASLLIITGVLYQYFGNMQESQLKDELSLVATATEKLGISYLENLDRGRNRFTLIAEDGSVLFDTHVDVLNMENHADREEVKEALFSGSGGSARWSNTLLEKTIYEAIRLSNRTVLRISTSRVGILALILGMLQPVVVILLIALGLSAWLANRMAQKVVEPLNTLDLDHPLQNEVYEELSPLLRRIHAQHREIKEQVLTLKNKQDEFEQITSNLKEALVLLDNIGRILSINQAARILFEAGDSCIGEDFLTIYRRQCMRDAMAEADKKGQSSFRAKLRGKEYQFDINRIESDGKYQGTVILAFDITEQVHAEKHRKEFTANISHELKTPLQSIIGSAELMENGIVKTEDIPRFVGHIRKEAFRLVFLIDDIIRLSQLDEGVELPREEVSLKVLAKEVFETLEDAAKLKDISMELYGDEGMMYGVRRLLYEVIYNLCDNALKYNHQGGNIKIGIVEEANKVILRVQDTGIGIAAQYQEKIFERFYRVDKSHSKQSGGTGLGLSIVKHAVQYHSGRIEVESEENKGTTISVIFDISGE